MATKRDWSGVIGEVAVGHLTPASLRRYLRGGQHMQCVWSGKQEGQRLVVNARRACLVARAVKAPSAHWSRPLSTLVQRDELSPIGLDRFLGQRLCGEVGGSILAHHRDVKSHAGGALQMKSGAVFRPSST